MCATTKTSIATYSALKAEFRHRDHVFAAQRLEKQEEVEQRQAKLFVTAATAASHRNPLRPTPNTSPTADHSARHIPTIGESDQHSEGDGYN